MLGTDSGGMAPDSPPPTAGVHPRAWGSAARILGKYVREEKLLPLEEAVRKMTSLPAQRMRLWDRGVSARAPSPISSSSTRPPSRDQATFEEPRQAPRGMRFVAVNGQLVVDGGQITAARSGRALRGPGYRTRSGTGTPSPATARMVRRRPPRTSLPCNGWSTTTSGSIGNTRSRDGASCSCRRSPPRRRLPGGGVTVRTLDRVLRRPGPRLRQGHRDVRNAGRTSSSNAAVASPPHGRASSSTRTARRAAAGSS